MLSMIVAVADDLAIGRKNGLPWHLSGDLKRFKAITSGHPIIMGENTFISLGRVLPKRQHYVLSWNENFSVDHERVHVYRDLMDVVPMAKESDDEWFIIGGASIYKASLDLVDRLYLTKVHTTVPDADAFFPEFKEDEWEVLSVSEMQQDDENGPCYEYIDLKRK